MEKLKNIIKLWTDEKKLYVKPSTYATYVLLIENHLLPYFKKACDLNEKNVQNFVLLKIKQGLSQKSIKDIVVVLKMIYKFAVRNNFLNSQRLDVKFPIFEQKGELQVLNKKDYKKLLNYLKENLSFKNLGILVCLLTGMRIGEICGLKWQDIDVNSGIIMVRRTLQRIYILDENKNHTELICGSPKTKSSIRDIPLTSELLKILKAFKKFSNIEHYILTNKEKPLEPRSFRSYYKNLLNKIGLEHINFHALRHSFATRCIESNCDYKTVSVILGHSSINTTLNLYVHPNLEQKKKCIEQMLKKL